jgi:hypothetical protein
VRIGETLHVVIPRQGTIPCTGELARHVSANPLFAGSILAGVSMPGNDLRARLSLHHR